MGAIAVSESAMAMVAVTARIIFISYSSTVRINMYCEQRCHGSVRSRYMPIRGHRARGSIARNFLDEGLKNAALASSGCAPQAHTGAKTKMELCPIYSPT
jgi:hypothetical protein